MFRHSLFILWCKVSGIRINSEKGEAKVKASRLGKGLRLSLYWQCVPVLCNKLMKAQVPVTVSQWGTVYYRAGLSEPQSSF